MKKKKEASVEVATLSKEERAKIFATMKTTLKKQLGDGIIADQQSLHVESISTGSPLLDSVITGDGYAKGRFIELSGENSCGKSTTATIMLAEAQKAYPDEMVGYIDVEHAINIKYAEKLGLDLSPDRFILVQPSSAEDAFTALDAFVSSGLFSVVCFDSVGALVTEDQLAKGFDENTIGSLGRLMGKSISRINIAAASSNTAVIWINQIRTKITLFGSGETVAGGRAFPFFHSTRIKIKRTDIIKQNDKPIGQTVKYEIVKNKVGTPFGIVETAIYFGQGYDEYTEIVELAYTLGIIVGGAWCYVDRNTENEMRWNGKNACLAWFRENPEKFQEFKIRVLTQNKGLVVIDEAALDEDGDEVVTEGDG